MEFEVKILEQAEKFIYKLPVKMQAKIRRTIELLKKFGFSLSKPHSKKIKSVDYLYELRIKLGSDICRLFYFHYKENIYIITSGYVKKKDKTDKDEIKKAVNIMNQIMGD